MTKYFTQESFHIFIICCRLNCIQLIPFLLVTNKQIWTVFWTVTNHNKEAHLSDLSEIRAKT